MSSQACFHFFPLLPTELRLVVWGFSVSNSSTTFLDGDKHWPNTTATIIQPKPAAWDISAIGHACHEARSVVRSLCERIELPESMFFEHPTTGRRGSGFWINFSTNIFYVGPSFQLSPLSSPFGAHLKYVVILDEVVSGYWCYLRILAKGFSALRLVVVITEFHLPSIDRRALKTLDEADESLPDFVTAPFKRDRFLMVDVQTLAPDFRIRAAQPVTVAVGPA